VRWQNPWAWMGLLTLALPILVHLFSRRRARIEPFPSLRFLDVSRLLPTRRTQLSDLPLLLIRLGVLAAAVAALAQPLFRADRRAGAMDASLARVIVLDTSALDDAAMAGADTNEGAAPAVTMVLPTHRPAMALPGAVEWLRTQPGRGEILVVSPFPFGSLDSVDIAGIPGDFGVRLQRAPAALRSGATVDTGLGIRWDVGVTPEIAEAVRFAVRAQGADALLAADLDSAARVIVASPGADSARAWIAAARPLSESWMGDVVFEVRGDSTLALASPLFSTVSDTAVSAPFVVIRRMSNGVPLVLAASIPGPGDGPDETSRLLLLSRAPAEHLATSALLLAVSRSLLPARVNGSDGARIGDEQLQRWERTPSARSTPSLADTSPDSGPSDGRWVWLLVLALLAVEAIVRRRSSRDAASVTVSTANASSRGTV
jgi:Aerotolerance regulator N-terminal